ncbi:MAG: hypothetical protein WAZ77_17950 [Candidatus Nitrosopolaris sp.]
MLLSVHQDFRRIQKFGGDGRFITKWNNSEGFGRGFSTFADPEDIT